MTEQKNQIVRENIHKLITTLKYHRQSVERLREKIGFGRTAHRMLMTIADNPACSQTDLAESLEISTAAVATTLKKLETDGYILRTANPSDSRFNITELTERGKHIVTATRKVFDENDNAMFAGFSEEELIELGGFLSRMQQNIRLYDEQSKNRKDDRI